MGPNRFYILLILAYFSSILLFINLVWAEDGSTTPTYAHQANISVPSTTNQSIERRLDVLDAQVNELIMSAKKPQKDIWDILSALSILISGAIIGILSLIATSRYQERQRQVMKIQTVQGFMPHLSSKNPTLVEGSLRSIATLDREIALSLADSFYSEGGLYALLKWLSNPKMEKDSREIIFDRISKTPFLAQNLLESGVTYDEMIKQMRKFYTERGVENAEVNKLISSIDLISRYKRRK